MDAHRRPFLLYTAMAFGYAFLYLPILAVVVYSFNASRMVTVWGGFSTQWYGQLFQNTQILEAAQRSLVVAVVTACFAVVLGTLAGLALARFGRVRGRGLLSLLTSAPLVMPEVILGLSALLLFVSMGDLIGWPERRGLHTITIAHITFSICYVTVIVRSRLTQMDQALEEAAMDLGARPWKVFFVITLPLIWPALVAGWLLAFTLSLDDLVVASFTSGPGASTLPMVIYSKVKLGVTPEINALATLLILAVTVGVSVAGWLMHRSAQRAQS
jgi:putrescine transport system permease protein